MLVIVASYALLHDQYVVRIEPRHFTEFHKPLFGIQNPVLLASVYALLASTSPGLTLGLVGLLSGRGGKRPPLPVRKVLVTSLWAVLATEVLSLFSMAWVYATRKPFYPAHFYPEMELPMMLTQTAQLSVYLGGALFGSCWALWLWNVRKKDFSLE